MLDFKTCVVHRIVHRTTDISRVFNGKILEKDIVSAELVGIHRITINIVKHNMSKI